jgi:hypothetical protein
MKYSKPTMTLLGSISHSVQGTQSGVKSFAPVEGAQAQPCSSTAGAYEVDE